MMCFSKREDEEEEEEDEIEGEEGGVTSFVIGDGEGGVDEEDGVEGEEAEGEDKERGRRRAMSIWRTHTNS